MWVLKLGGSLCRSPNLLEWVDTLARFPGKLVVVPGGGLFADAVRSTQTLVGFDDETAHRLAILAMQQMGELLCAQNSKFQRADNPEEIAYVAATGGVPIWFPDQMTKQADEVATSWDVTSDSLACWLAEQISAEGVLLIKSADLAIYSGELAVLQEDTIVDQAIHRHWRVGERPLRLLGSHQQAALAPLLAGEAQVPGVLAC